MSRYPSAAAMLVAIALAALYGNETNHTTQFSRLTVEE